MGTEKNKIAGDAPHLAPLLPKFNYASFWESPESLARYIDKQGQKAAWTDTAWSKDDCNWSGSNSMEETLKMAREGWPEGRERVERIRGYVQASNPIRKHPVSYGIAGVTPSVPRAVAGNIMNMRLPVDTKSKKRPILTLFFNMGAYYSVSPKAISNRSAVVAAIVDQIEAAGFSVEVLAVSPCSSGYGSTKWTMATTVMVKQSHQPSDIGRLSFGLGQTSMFRRMAFADRCLEPSAHSGLGGGLGSTMELVATEDDNFRGIYMLPSNNVCEELFTDEHVAATQGTAWLINELKKQKCPAFSGEPILTEREKEDVRNKVSTGITLGSILSGARKKRAR